jgi:hypothetical protein
VVNGRWPLGEAAALIEDWQYWAPNADEAINLELGLVAPDFLEEPAFVELFGIVAGSERESAAHLGALQRRLGSLAGRLSVWHVAPAEAALYCSGLLGHSLQPAWLPSRPYGVPGMQATRSHFFDATLARGAIENCVRLFGEDRKHAQYRELELVPWGGAYARGSSAFAHRQSPFLIRHTATTGARATPELRSHARAWTEGSFASLDGPASGRAYQGYAEPGRSNWHEACYGSALPRLRAIKGRYDPDGLFGRTPQG